MNSNTILLYAIVTVSLLTGGCKRFLAEKSQDELTPQTTASLDQLLAREGYPYVASSSTATDGYSLCNYLSWMDDDSHLQNYNTAIVNYAKPFYVWSNTMYADASVSAYAVGGANPYQNLYNRIRGCNVVMDMLSSVTGPQADKDRMKGEALTLRAYYYFMLVNLYGWPYNDSLHSRTTSLGVPLITSGGISETAVPRSTVQQVYDLITSDIEQAVTLLTEQKEISTVYRVNYRSAWLLASRIYLHMEQWDKVLAYTNKLIADYPIIADLNTMKVPVAQSLLFLNNANFIDPSNPEILFEFSAARSGDLSAFNTGGLSTPSFLASTDLINSYEPNDMRFAYYNASNPLPNFFLTRQSGFYLPSKCYVNGTAGRSFRMSEAYVNRAEATIRTVIAGGNASLQSALDDLNYLRSKRFAAGASNATVTLASLNNDPQQVLAFYKAERRREFCFEEFRWFDLRRYGQPGIIHAFNPNEPYVTNAALPVETDTLPAHSNRYVMMIPLNAMAANPTLVQNP